MPDIWTLLQRRTRQSGAQPIVTYVDPARGERTELSATSLANAAAKIANAMRDEYELEPGDRVVLDLPLHWQRATWCAGVWTAGCVVTDAVDEANLVVTTLERVQHLDTAAPRVVVSMHPFGLPVTDTLPAGVTDATLAVRQQPDAYLFETPDSSAIALGVDGRELSQEDLIAAALDLGFDAGSRVAITSDATPMDQLLGCLAVPLAIDGSVVLVPATDLPAWVIDQERITAEVR